MLNHYGPVYTMADVVASVVDIIACLYAKPHINNKEVKLRIKPVWWTLVWLQLVNLLRLLRHNISLFYYKNLLPWEPAI